MTSRALVCLLCVLCASPAWADPEVAELRAWRSGWLSHRLPAHAPVDGQARPRLPSSFDIDRVSIDLALQPGRILPEEASMTMRVVLLEAGIPVLPIFAVDFEPLEIRVDGEPVDFRYDRGSAELLIEFAEPRREEVVRVEMQVAYDDYCRDPTGCIEREQQQHIAQIGWYPLNGEVGPDDPFQVALRFAVADGRVPGATGRRFPPERDGVQVIWRFETELPTILPAFAIGPNTLDMGEELQIALPPGARDAGVIREAILDALGVYDELFGRYPFSRLGVSPISDSAGVGLGPQANILLPEVFWFIPPDVAESELVAQVVTHEVAHQYFFNLVNILDAGEGWMSEGFAEYASTRVSEVRTGTRDHARLNYWDYMLNVDRRQDAALSSEQVDLRPPDVRQRIIYFKGAALLQQLRDRYPGFDEHMRDWVQSNANVIVTTRDFIGFMADRLGPSAQAFIAQWTGRPGYPTLVIAVSHPRDGADQMEIRITQVDGAGFEGTVPMVAQFADGGTQPIDLDIGRPVAQATDLGRAQGFVLDPDLTLFRRAIAEPQGDVNLSGVVDGMDLLDVLAEEGMAVPDPNWRDLLDVDRDLQIDQGDRRAIIGNWGAGW